MKKKIQMVRAMAATGCKMRIRCFASPACCVVFFSSFLYNFTHLFFFPLMLHSREGANREDYYNDEDEDYNNGN